MNRLLRLAFNLAAAMWAMFFPDPDLSFKNSWRAVPVAAVTAALLALIEFVRLGHGGALLFGVAFVGAIAVPAAALLVACARIEGPVLRLVFLASGILAVLVLITFGWAVLQH